MSPCETTLSSISCVVIRSVTRVGDLQKILNAVGVPDLQVHKITYTAGIIIKLVPTVQFSNYTPMSARDQSHLQNESRAAFLLGQLCTKRQP